MGWLLGALGIGGLGAALFFIPGLLPRAIEAAGALLGVVRRYPLQAALVASLCLAGWLWWGKGKAIDQRDAAVAGRRADRAAYTAAQAEAQRLALAAKAATEARYKANAERVQNAYEAKFADVRSAAASFIDANRLRPGGVGGSPGQAASATDHRNPRVPVDVSASALVAVSDVDVQRCSDTAAYAVAAREWALGLAK